MKVNKIMKNDVDVVYEDTSLVDAAREMENLNIGSIPVRKGDRLIGMITDRDIVVRGVAKGLDLSQAKVADYMTSPIVYAFEDQETEAVAQIMEEKKVRRLPILDRNKRLVGIVSLSDIDDENLAGHVLRKVAVSSATPSAAV